MKIAFCLHGLAGGKNDRGEPVDWNEITYPLYKNHILDKNNVIVAGHTRLQAAIKLGLQEVPVIWADDLTEEQIKAFRIMDNKSQDYAQWDFDLLKLELEDLKSANFDLKLTGFSEIDIDKFLDGDYGEKPINLSENPKYQINRGDIYQLGEHRLLCGDSSNEEEVNKILKDKNPILMVTDPPYGVQYDASWRNKTNLQSGIKRPTRATDYMTSEEDTITDWSKSFKHFKGDIAYIWHAGKYTYDVAKGLKDLNFDIIAQIIWVKPHFALSRGDYNWKHEPCFYAVKKGKNHNWQGSNNQVTTWEMDGMNAFGKSKDPEDEQTGHATQKPIECMKKPILNNSKEGDTIYEPFGGSGTTLIACELTKRKCICIELESKFVSAIIERFINLVGDKEVYKVEEDGTKTHISKRKNPLE